MTSGDLQSWLWWRNHNHHYYVCEDLIVDIFHGISDLLQLFGDLVKFPAVFVVNKTNISIQTMTFS